MIPALLGFLEAAGAMGGGGAAARGAVGGAIGSTGAAAGASASGAMGSGFMARLAGASPHAAGLPTATPVAMPIPTIPTASAVPKSQLVGEQMGGALKGVNKQLDAIAKPMKLLDKSLGVVTDAFTKASDIAVDYATKPLQLVDKGFKLLTDTVGKAGGVVAAYATKPLTMLTQGLNAINGPALQVIGSLGAFRDAVTAVGNSMAQFTQLANPAITQQFRFASDDLTASIGKALIPAMQFATKFTRSFADVVFTLAGPLQRLTSAVFKPLGEAADAVLAALSPVVRMVGRLTDRLADILRPLGDAAGTVFGDAFDLMGAQIKGVVAATEPLITVMAQVAASSTKMFAALANNPLMDLARRSGVVGPRDSIAGAGDGAAVRNVGFSSAEQYQNTAIKSAYSLGTASAEDRTADGVTTMAEELKALPEAIWMKFLGGAASLAKAFREGIPGGEAAGAISEGRLPSRESLTPNLGTLTDRALDAGRRLEGEARAAWNRLRGRDDG